MIQKSKHNASGSMAGYLFQCRLALLYGLQMAKKNPNGHISIEKFDDVAFEDQDLSKCLLQAKHSVNPKSLDDMSIDVWKTLYIWINQLTQGIITFSSTKFVLITTSEAAEGSAIALLRDGSQIEDRKKCYSLLRKAAQESENQKTAEARTAFLSLEDTEALTLLQQIRVLDKHPNLIDVTTQIEGEIILIAPSNATEAARYLEGWWLNIVGRCLLETGNTPIPVQNIIRKANEIGGYFSGDALPIDDPDKLGVKGYSGDDESEIFVRQMRVVNLSDSMVERGVHDYYRAYAQRSKWARENLLLDSELGKYDENLKDRWERRFDAQLMTTPPTSELQKKLLGCRLLVWASELSIPLRNIVETWITSGSFHGLANRLQIGWHPDFETIFEKELANGSS